MPRRPRGSRGGEVFHAINRGNCRMPIFEKDLDYLAFLKLLEEGRQRVGMRVLAYCLMPNHWHLVLGPQNAADLSNFFRWVCTTHVRRWRMHRHNSGEGHLYQGRFKSFPIQQDEHLLQVLAYVEANPLRAKLVERAQDWPYSSLGQGSRPVESRVQLDAQIIRRPANWLQQVNRPVAQARLEHLHLSVQRGQPYGSARWTPVAAARLGLESSLRHPGRPRKTPDQAKRGPKNV